MAVTQKSFVDDSSSVKAARKKLDKAKAALADAKKAKAGLPANSGKDIAAQIDTRISDAQKESDTQALAVAEIEAKAKNYFTKNEPAIQEKAIAKQKATGESNIGSVEAQRAQMAKAGLDTTAIDKIIADAKTKANAPVIADNAGGAKDGSQGGTEQKPDDFSGLIKSAPEYIKKLSGPGRKLLAQSLNDSLDAKLVVSELIDPASLLAAYQQAIGGAQARYNTFADIFSVDQYLSQKKLETAAIKAAGGSASKLPEPSTSISAGTEAAASISAAFKNVLGREATPAEISILTKELNAAERDPKNAQRAKRNKNGIIEYSGGLKVDQWLTDKLQALPEFATKKQAKQDLTTQSISSTALANGIKLSEAQLKTYSDRVKNGEDIKTIESQIRNTAGLGQPDTIKKMLADGTDLNTIYDPYRRMMATSLGLTPDSITLDDPTLRMAIGPDKEMSLYDYKKAIRQDNRWKNSQEANDEVTSMINQVKRDFGFMG